jgi:quinol-cytochrome oxidoreductase complex cytochrome b subunit
VRTAVRVCLGLLAVAFVALVATGAWLWFRYQPGVGWIGDVHRVAAIVFVTIAVVVVVLAIVRRLRDHARGPLACSAVLVAGVAAAVTGRLLPWDSLALWAVTAGNKLTGVSAAFDSSVLVVGIDGREVTPSTYEFWAYAHLGVAVLVAAALVLAWSRTRLERAESPEAELVRSS